MQRKCENCTAVLRAAGTEFSAEKRPLAGSQKNLEKPQNSACIRRLIMLQFSPCENQTTGGETIGKHQVRYETGQGYGKAESAQPHGEVRS